VQCLPNYLTTMSHKSGNPLKTLVYHDRVLQNQTIFVNPMKRVDFSEVTGGPRRASRPRARQVTKWRKICSLSSPTSYW